MPYPNRSKKTMSKYPWRAQVKIKGKKYTKLVKTKAEGREWEAQRRATARSLKTHITSLVEWGTKYLAFCESKGVAKKTFEEKQKALAMLMQFDEVDPHGDIHALDSLTVYSHLVAQSVSLGDNGRPRGGGGANKDLKNLKAAWNWGIKYMGLSQENPFNRIDTFAQNSKPRVMPSLGEFEAVLAAAPTEQDRAMLITYLYTAARREELFRLEWSHVDFKEGRIMLRSRKNKNGEWWDDWLNLDPRLVAPLKACQKVTGFFGHVFVNFQGSDKPKYWRPYLKRQHWLENLCEVAGVEKFGFHGIRHLCASILASENVPLVEIQHHLRHRSIRTTEKYIHKLDKKENQAVVKALPDLNIFSKMATPTAPPKQETGT